MRSGREPAKQRKRGEVRSSPLLSGPKTARLAKLLFALPLSQVVNEEFPCGGTLVAFLIAPLENPACSLVAGPLRGLLLLFTDCKRRRL